MLILHQQLYRIDLRNKTEAVLAFIELEKNTDLIFQLRVYLINSTHPPPNINTRIAPFNFVCALCHSLFRSSIDPLSPIVVVAGEIGAA